MERTTFRIKKLMRTTIDIDNALMRKAMRLSDLSTKKQVVEAALRLFIQTHSQVGIRRLRGKVKGEGSIRLVVAAGTVRD
jgi:Arc/MetJ family transcription regulator